MRKGPRLSFREVEDGPAAWRGVKGRVLATVWTAHLQPAQLPAVTVGLVVQAESVSRVPSDDSLAHSSGPQRELTAPPHVWAVAPANCPCRCGRTPGWPLAAEEAEKEPQCLQRRVVKCAVSSCPFGGSPHVEALAGLTAAGGHSSSLPRWWTAHCLPSGVICTVSAAGQPVGVPLQNLSHLRPF